ncbi:hypothetical protein [Caballeronia cordobensis]|uniref:hypothetical protein n=1 Tax=Caballeronia cordobensis TaxID=1353886 RepID=UPI001177708D|nr:hypothetical protein [Caballeronia cordobensis]
MHIAWVDLPDGSGGGPRRLDGRSVVIRANRYASYASRYLSFPQQQLTIDQCFDESPFESYRKFCFCAGLAARENFPAKPRQRK